MKGSKAAVALLALAFVVPLLVIVMVVGGVAPPCDQQGAGGSGGGPGTGALAAGGIPVAFVPLIQKAGALDAAFPAPVLAAQIQQESGFHASAVSSTGAMGYSQFEPQTWASYGKDTTGKGSADPNNFSDAVDAQARYDHDLANQVRAAQAAGKIHSTASVTEMALGGYNAGIGAVLAAGGVPGNAQTSAYVPAIMNMARGKFSAAGTTAGAAPGAPVPGGAPAAPAAGAGVSASGGCGSPGQVQVLALTYPSSTGVPMPADVYLPPGGGAGTQPPRQGFYAGAFGRDLVEMSEGLFTSADLEAVHGDWVSPLRIRVFDHDVWAVPPNSPGYIVLGAAWLSQRIGLPDDITDPAWPHLLIEAVRQASFDRRAVLYQDSDGAALISEERLRPRLENIQTRRSTSLGGTYVSGDTTYLCVVDGERTAVSLIQSLAKPFGSHLFMQGHDSVLNNRGVSFSLEPGHPAELRPGRRPPHTLAPLLVTRPDGKLQTILGTMGGDIQPQVLLQLLVRTLVLRESPAYSLAAARWALSSENTTGFDTWDDGLAAVRVLLESDCPEPWVNGLVERGHQVEVLEPLANRFGHAALISVLGDALAGASDPRAASSGVRGYN